MISNSAYRKVKGKLYLPVDVLPSAPSPVVAAFAGFGDPQNADNLNITVSGIVAGDLLFASACSVLSLTPFTGWTLLASAGVNGDQITQCYARIATGSGDNFTSSAGDKRFSCSAQVLRITGHGVSSIASDIKKGAYTSTQAANSGDPPSLDAGSVKNWLWIATLGVNTNASGITAAPSGFTLVAAQSSGGSGPYNTGDASFESTSSQIVDPGNFTHAAGAASGNVHANTVAIPPA